MRENFMSNLTEQSLEYFVSFNAKRNSGGNVFGDITLTLDEPISSGKGLDEVKKFIGETGGFQDVVIINIQRFPIS
jgi:hypothetical protein